MEADSILLYRNDAITGDVLKLIVTKIISKAENIGLSVQAVISDMGSNNQSMWKEFSIKISRIQINYYCQHICDANRKLYFCSDVPHALKNIVCGFLLKKVFKIPQYFVDKYNLPTCDVRASYLSDVIKEDENCVIKLAPKVKKDYVEGNKFHFQKMKVSYAMSIMSNEVSSALRFLYNDNPNDGRQSTA